MIVVAVVASALAIFGTWLFLKDDPDPRVTISFYHHSEKGAGWRVMTDLAPGVARWLEVRVDGKPIRGGWQDLLSELGIEGDVGWDYLNLPAGTLLTEGGANWLFRTKPGPSVPLLVRHVERVSLSLCYCAVTGDEDACWLAKEIGEPLEHECGSNPDMFLGTRARDLR